MTTPIKIRLNKQTLECALKISKALAMLRICLDKIDKVR